MPTPSQPNKRWLARKVTVDGVEHGLSLVETDGSTFTVEPYECETHSTSYVSSIVVTTTASGMPIIEINP